MQEPLNLANLPIPLQQILPPIYTYKIKNYTEFEPIITTENVNIGQNLSATSISPTKKA